MHLQCVYTLHRVSGSNIRYLIFYNLKKLEPIFVILADTKNILKHFIISVKLALTYFTLQYFR